MDKVSIIVPVYNKQNYLDDCITSIINQSYKNFECILVNDGSTDNSLNICNKYSQLDNRIIVVNKSNGGVSSARNAGIMQADSKFTVFVDSDDTLPSNSIMLLVKKFKNNTNVDMIVGGFNTITKDVCNNIFLKDNPKRENIICDLSIQDSFNNLFNKNNMLSVWGKMFLTDIIKNNNIYFDESLIVLEDFCFVIDYLIHSKFVMSISDFVYNYFDLSANSYYKRSKFDYVNDVIYANKKFVNYLKSSNFDTSLSQKIINSNLFAAYNNLWMSETCGFMNRLKKYNRIKEVLKYTEYKNFIQYNRQYFSESDYFFMKHACVYGIVLLGFIRKIIKRFKSYNMRLS